MKYKIEHDSDAESPRDWDNMGKIIYCSSRYKLGDEKVSSDRITEIMEDDSLISLPVYAYIHGGVVLNTKGFSCPWDSGQCGAIYVSKESVKTEWDVKEITPELYEIVINNLKSEIETYSSYLSGEVYGYLIIDDDGNQIDSCFGFYGYKQAEEAANEAMLSFKKDEDTESCEL